MNVMRKSFAYIALVLFAFLQIPFSASAHTPAPSSSGGPVLDIGVQDTTYRSQDHTVTFELQVNNISDRFIDNLKYRIEFYHGDALNTDGLLFSTVDFVISAHGDLSRLHPNQQRVETIEFTPPRTIPSGKYFFRVFAFNEDNSVFGATFTRDPLLVSGRGGFLGIITAALINPNKGSVHGLREGPILEKGSRPLVAILKEFNEQLFERFEGGEQMYVSYDITHITAPETIILETERQSLQDLLRGDGQAVEIYFDPWENQLAGAHTATLAFTNERGDLLAEEMQVRLLYEGLLGRIFHTDTYINAYRRGEPISLNVNVLAAGDEAAEFVTLTATLKDTEGRTQILEKKIDLPKTFRGIDRVIVFNDYRADRAMVVEEIDLVLRDQYGNILDSRIETMDPDVLFMYDKGSMMLRTILISLLVLLIVVFAGGFIYKKTRGISLSIILALSFIGGALWYAYPDSVQADAGLHPGDVPLVYTIPVAGDSKDDQKPQLTGMMLGSWEDPVGQHIPSGHQGLCENQCLDLVFWVKLQCKQCGNDALALTINYFNDWQGQVSPTGEHDRQFNVTTVSGFSAYGEYLVFDDDIVHEQFFASDNQTGELQDAPMGSLAKGSDANDGIAWWLYGPFQVDFCFEENGVIIDENGMCQPSPRLNQSTGIYAQKYNIQAITYFGEGHCELSFSFEDENPESPQDDIDQFYEQHSGVLVLNNVHEVECDAPGCIKGSFFLDENSDGVRQLAEPYFRHTGTLSGWGGIAADLFGRISGNDAAWGNLIATSFITKPHFMLHNVPPGTYTFGLDPALSSDRWAQAPQQVIVTGGQTAQTELGVSCATCFTCSIDLTGGGTTGNNGGDPFVYGCTEPTASNYNAEANVDDGSCVWGPHPPGPWVGPGPGPGPDPGPDPDPDPTPPNRCPGIEGQNAYQPPSLSIIQKAHNLNSCLPHKDPMSCDGPDYPYEHDVYGVTITLTDPCYPQEVWNISTFLNGELQDRVWQRVHGNSWDVDMRADNPRSLEKGGSHDIRVQGWKGHSSTNPERQTEVGPETDTIDLPDECECDPPTDEDDYCDDYSAMNYGAYEACMYDTDCDDGYCYDDFYDPDAEDCANQGGTWYDGPGICVRPIDEEDCWNGGGVWFSDTNPPSCEW